jgi:hypothetical protein
VCEVGDENFSEDVSTCCAPDSVLWVVFYGVVGDCYLPRGRQRGKSVIRVQVLR